MEQAQAVVTALGGVDGLARATAESLTEVEGIGPAQAARGLAAILLPLISSLEYEAFVVLFLDTHNRVVDQETLYKRTLNTSMVRIAEVFRGAVRRNYASIVVAHTHPSRDSSPADRGRGQGPALLEWEHVKPPAPSTQQRYSRPSGHR